MPRLAMLILVTVAASLPALADDTASLPLGDPARAYLLTSGEAGHTIDCRDLASTGPVDFDRMIADLASADVVLIGEHHTSLDGHKYQAHVFDALVRAASGSPGYGAAAAPAGGKPRPVVLGMEFFDTRHDPALANFIAGHSDLDQLLHDTRWYATGNYNFEYYRPLLETARASHSEVRGLNVPREVVRAYSRAQTDSLQPDDRALIGDLGPINERHRYLVNAMMDNMGAAMPDAFAGMYTGQTVWDAAMAGSIARVFDTAKPGTPRPLVVVIVGSGHVAHGLGIPTRLHDRAPSLNIKTLAPVAAHHPDPDASVHPGFEPKETAVFSRGYADYAYILPDDDGYQEYPQFGLRIEHPKGAASPTARPLDITSVTKGGIAERAGLRKGDRLVAINGEEMLTPEAVNITLATLRWGDRARLELIRLGGGGGGNGGNELTIHMLVVPPTDGDLDWLKSDVDSSLLDSFDYTSTRSYLVDRHFKPATPHARLVRRRDKAIRIDVMDGPRLLQAWDLDDNGRPARALLATPAPDGAVRIELQRDPTGKVTEERRFNTEGERIQPPAPPAR